MPQGFGVLGGHHLAGAVPAGLRGAPAPQAPSQRLPALRRRVPNKCWQADVTHWAVADGTQMEILNVIDDHSRLLVASRAFETTKAADVVETFHAGVGPHGAPASMLTDNGAIFTAESRHGRCAMETELAVLGVLYKHSRPYHPQTCGRSSASTQTLKKYPGRQPRPATLEALQVRLDRFGAYTAIAPRRRSPSRTWRARSASGRSLMGYGDTRR